jgi:hypothetical protein
VQLLLHRKVVGLADVVVRPGGPLIRHAGVLGCSHSGAAPDGSPQAGGSSNGALASLNPPSSSE